MSRLHDRYVEDGYAIVRSLYDPQRVERLRAICEGALEAWRNCDPYTGQPGDKPDAVIVRHVNHPVYFREHPEWFPEVMDAVADERLLDAATDALDEPPMFRCTTLFFNPSGIRMDGDWHRDCQFVVGSDEEECDMVLHSSIAPLGMQMQISLIHNDDLEIVPGSQRRWDTSEEYAIRKADDGKNRRSNDMPGALRPKLEPGDAILFNPMGLHRGRYHSDIPRRTFMVTVTRASEPVYDEFSVQPWFLDPDYLAPLKPQTRRFFEPFVAQYQGWWADPATARWR